MIVPIQKGQQLLADIASASASANEFHVWWLGQSGFLVKWQENHLLFDPYLSDSLTKKYAQSDKPHTRMTEQAIDSASLDMVDVVTSSHNHTDHLDAETLWQLSIPNPDLKLVLPEANFEFAKSRLGDLAPEFVALNEGSTATVGPFEFHGIAAAHNEIERDELGRCKFLGFVVKFGEFAIYHSGDTLWHRDLVRQIAPFGVDLALVPINGNKPERRVAGNLDGLEAAAVAKGCGAKMAIPHHFEMFEFNTASPEEFVSSCRRFDQPQTVLRCGERFSMKSD
ncbi:MAG: L-ascorbate metabolism protein UlaG (beta-lactamase superfamily) [Verrucomicrobiales bacterium]|jgi:L-ascorbate metabolism protein UlaG (beta-lactamase superfamily)